MSAKPTIVITEGHDGSFACPFVGLNADKAVKILADLRASEGGGKVRRVTVLRNFKRFKKASFISPEEKKLQASRQAEMEKNAKNANAPKPPTKEELAAREAERIYREERRVAAEKAGLAVAPADPAPKK